MFPVQSPSIQRTNRAATFEREGVTPSVDALCLAKCTLSCGVGLGPCIPKCLSGNLASCLSCVAVSAPGCVSCITGCF